MVPAGNDYEIMSINQRKELYISMFRLLQVEHKKNPTVNDVVLAMAMVASRTIEDVDTIINSIKQMKSEQEMINTMEKIKNERTK